MQTLRMKLNLIYWVAINVFHIADISWFLMNTDRAAITQL